MHSDNIEHFALSIYALMYIYIYWFCLFISAGTAAAAALCVSIDSFYTFNRFYKPFCLYFYNVWFGLFSSLMPIGERTRESWIQIQ